MTMTADETRVLEIVRDVGNRLMRGDPSLRYGVSARTVAARCDWRSETGPSWDRRTRPATRAAVNRLLALRRRGLVADVDGRWYTTDEGERVLLAERQAVA